MLLRSADDGSLEFFSRILFLCSFSLFLGDDSIKD